MTTDRSGDRGEWDVGERTDHRASRLAHAPGALARFRRDLGDAKAWWLLPALLTLAAVATLLVLARGDLSVPEIYRTH